MALQYGLQVSSNVHNACDLITPTEINAVLKRGLHVSAIFVSNSRLWI